MKRYRFRLDTVLRVRRVAESLARADVAKAVSERRRAEDAVALAAARSEALVLPAGITDAAAFLDAHAAAERVVLAHQGALDRCADARLAQLDALARLAGTSRRVAVLKRLDARSRAAWRAEEARADAYELDDFASQRALARRREARRDA